MAWNFKPGMKVVCVDADTHGRFLLPHHIAAPGGLHGLVQGAIYTIRDVGNWGPYFVVWLDEISRPITTELSRRHGESGYSPHRFRPIRTTSIASLEAHLNTLPVRKTEKA